MNRGIVLAGVLAAVGAAPAGAVDLVNHDRVAREVVINRSDGSSETLTAKPKEKLANVCKACVILIANSSVEAIGSETVTIEDGKVSINAHR